MADCSFPRIGNGLEFDDYEISTKSVAKSVKVDVLNHYDSLNNALSPKIPTENLSHV